MRVSSQVSPSRHLRGPSCQLRNYLLQKRMQRHTNNLPAPAFNRRSPTRAAVHTSLPPNTPRFWPHPKTTCRDSRHVLPWRCHGRRKLNLETSFQHSDTSGGVNLIMTFAFSHYSIFSIKFPQHSTAVCAVTCRVLVGGQPLPSVSASGFDSLLLPGRVLGRIHVCT